MRLNQLLDRWEKMLNMCDDEGNLVSSASSYGNSGSGGWLEHIFRHATKQLYDVDLGSAPLRYVQVSCCCWFRK